MSGDRQSVSELVRSYGDQPEGQKRDRSESGDAAPAGKRGARDRGGEPGRSPATHGGRSFKECLETAIDDPESRVLTSFSRDLHEFRETLSEEVSRLHDRVKDLEKHVEDRDIAIAELTDELRVSRAEVSALQVRVEEAEVNSRLPCLVLSGPAMAPRHAPRLEPPLRDRAAPGATGASPLEEARSGQGQSEVTSRSADLAAGAAGAPGGSARSVSGGGGPDERGGDSERREDINALVVNTLNHACKDWASQTGRSTVPTACQVPTIG